MQLQNPSANVMEALLRLSNNGDFTLFIDWLRDERRNQSELNDNQHDEVTLRQGQGAAQALRAIDDLVINARNKLEAMRRKQQSAR